MEQQGTDVTESRRGGLLVSLWAAPSQAVLDLSLGGEPQIQVPVLEWCMATVASVCQRLDANPDTTSHQAGRLRHSRTTLAWTWLATCLYCFWREDSPLQGRHAGRVPGLRPWQQLQNSEKCLLLPPENLNPKGFSCFSQYSLLHLFRIQGTWESLQEEFWRWSHTCPRIFVLWVPLTPWGDTIQRATQLSLRVRPALSLTYLVAAGKLSGLFPLS